MAYSIRRRYARPAARRSVYKKPVYKKRVYKFKRSTGRYFVNKRYSRFKK